MFKNIATSLGYTGSRWLKLSSSFIHGQAGEPISSHLPSGLFVTDKKTHAQKLIVENEETRRLEMFLWQAAETSGGGAQ